ncbi:hypothetical protein E2C01_005906 [Portunus trituberculatus]|uniref:Uncharacterized protein n=1 Tax=Portunus trituberculatus TaxID=210409 RepID=A0A5B7CVN9_PORTR|nr:hypothetical protein [Portunus trituberculatus]
MPLLCLPACPPACLPARLSPRSTTGVDCPSELVPEDEVLKSEPPLTTSMTSGQHDVTHRVPGHLTPHGTRALRRRVEAEEWRRFGTDLSFAGHGNLQRRAMITPGEVSRQQGGIGRHWWAGGTGVVSLSVWTAGAGRLRKH